MILFLLLSILTSACLFIILKKFKVWKVETLHGLTVNYWTAAAMSFLVSPVENSNRFNELSAVWPACMLIGFSFIMVFYTTAKTTQVAGVGVASIASKMSMVIPIGAGLLLYNESLGVQKAIGILLAIPAVIITSKPSSSENNTTKLSLQDYSLPILLFLGAGLVDTAIKFAQHSFMNDDNRQLIIMSIFGFAGLFGTLRLLYEIFFLDKKLSLVSIGAGILLGVVNYLSLYFLLRCLEAPGSESSTVFAFVNTGVVITSFFAGMWLFNEKPDRNKFYGLILAIIAIVILSY